MKYYARSSVTRSVHVRASLAPLVVALTFFLRGVFAADDPAFDNVGLGDFQASIVDADKAYRQDNYEQAFAGFKRAACAGDKTSQAMVGRTYLLGQGVARDDLTGYAWLVTASESGLTSDRMLYRKIENEMTAEHLASGRARAQTFLQRYDAGHTKMACHSRASAGGRIEDMVVCTPRSDGEGKVTLRTCVD